MPFPKMTDTWRKARDTYASNLYKTTLDKMLLNILPIRFRDNIL